jgi:hypothetical protein
LRDRPRRLLALPSPPQLVLSVAELLTVYGRMISSPPEGSA